MAALLIFTFFISLFAAAAAAAASHGRLLPMTTPNHTATKKLTLPIRYISNSINLSDILAQENQRFHILTDDNSSIAFVTPTSSASVATLDIGEDEATQPVSLVIDPGSRLIWWQCNCEAASSHCYQQKEGLPVYSKEKSESYFKLECEDPKCTDEFQCSLDYTDPQENGSFVCVYNWAYGDGTRSKGIVSTEQLMLETEQGGSLELDITFGCGDYQNITRTPYTETSGVLGLSNHSLGLTSQLNASVFSVCLPSRIFGNTSSTIDFSTVWSPPSSDREHIITDLIQPPMGNEVGWYYVDILQVEVGTDKVDVPESIWKASAYGGGTIVDFGSTFTYFPSEAYTKLRGLFMTKLRENNPQLIPINVQDAEACYELIPPNLELNSLNIPAITITFRDGVKYDTRKPDQVMFKLGSFPGACLAFRPVPDENTIPSILGNVLFQRTRTHFALKESLIAFEFNACNLNSSKK